MTKTERAVVVEFLDDLSENDLFILGNQLEDRLPGDLDSALQFISIHKSMDQVFSACPSAWDLYDAIDSVTTLALRKCHERGIELKPMF